MPRLQQLSLSHQRRCRSPSCEQYKGKHLCSNAVASPVDAVGSHRTPLDSAQFEHAQNKRCGSVLTGRSKRAQWGCHSRAVRSPTCNAVRPPWARTRVVEQTRGHPCCLHGYCKAFFGMSLQRLSLPIGGRILTLFRLKIEQKISQNDE